MGCYRTAVAGGGELTADPDNTEFGCAGACAAVITMDGEGFRV